MLDDAAHHLTDRRYEIRLPDVDGFGEIRVSVCSRVDTGELLFRFAVHTYADEDQTVIDVSPDDAMLGMTELGGVVMRHVEAQKAAVTAWTAADNGTPPLTTTAGPRHSPSRSSAASA